MVAGSVTKKMLEVGRLPAGYLDGHHWRYFLMRMLLFEKELNWHRRGQSRATFQLERLILHGYCSMIV